MNDSSANYQSYMLRLWRPDGSSNWRIQIESIHSGQRQSFSELPGLVQFLQSQISRGETGEPSQDWSPGAPEFCIIVPGTTARRHPPHICMENEDTPMNIRGFLLHLENHNCTIVWGDHKYMATNNATGATSVFARNGNKIAEHTARSVCTELSIPVPVLATDSPAVAVH